MSPKLKRYGVRYFKTSAFRRGVLGTSRGWFAVWVAITGFGMLRRRIGRAEDVVYRTELRPGEKLLIEHTTTTRAELRTRRNMTARHEGPAPQPPT